MLTEDEIQRVHDEFMDVIQHRRPPDVETEATVTGIVSALCWVLGHEPCVGGAERFDEMLEALREVSATIRAKRDPHL